MSIRNYPIFTSSLTEPIGSQAGDTWLDLSSNIVKQRIYVNNRTASWVTLFPITSTGDLIIGNGPNSATRLPIGANTHVLTSNGTTATWAAIPGGGGSVTTGKSIAMAIVFGG
jgi:hypothetical protein